MYNFFGSHVNVEIDFLSELSADGHHFPQVSAVTSDDFGEQLDIV
jgi:hypothetical protein